MEIVGENLGTIGLTVQDYQEFCSRVDALCDLIKSPDYSLADPSPSIYEN